MIVLKEYRKEFDRLSSLNWNWEESNIDFIVDFSSYPKASFIPGSITHLPLDWRTTKETYFDRETGYFQFCCSLKNYDSTIENFIELVLESVIEELILLEIRCENRSKADHYEMADGIIYLRNSK